MLIKKVDKANPDLFIVSWEKLIKNLLYQNGQIHELKLRFGLYLTMWLYEKEAEIWNTTILVLLYSIIFCVS